MFAMTHDVNGLVVVFFLFFFCYSGSQPFLFLAYIPKEVISAGPFHKAPHLTLYSNSTPPFIHPITAVSKNFCWWHVLLLYWKSAIHISKQEWRYDCPLWCASITNHHVRQGAPSCTNRGLSDIYIQQSRRH